MRRARVSAAHEYDQEQQPREETEQIEGAHRRYPATTTVERRIPSRIYALLVFVHYLSCGNLMVSYGPRPRKNALQSALRTGR